MPGFFPIVLTAVKFYDFDLLVTAVSNHFSSDLNLNRNRNPNHTLTPVIGTKFKMQSGPLNPNPNPN